MTAEDSSTLPRRQLGRYLRNGRLDANMTLDDVAPLMEWSTSKLNRIERGQAGQIRVLDVKELCRIYELSEEMTAALVELAQQAAVKNWWHVFDDVIIGNFSVYLGLESSARELTLYRQDVVPGLFQTPDYIRAMDRLRRPDDDPVESNRRVELRIRRQSLITRKTLPAKVDAVIHESALRTMVGGPQTMANQLHRIANLPANATVRVLTYRAGLPLGVPTGPFVILDFGHDSKGREVEPTVVYTEGYAGDMYLEREREVAMYRQAFATIQHAAVDIPTSKSLMRQLAKEFEHERR